MTMLGIDFLEHGLDLIGASYIDFVNGDAQLVLGILGAQINDEGIERIQVVGVCQGEMDALLRKLMSACGANSRIDTVALDLSLHSENAMRCDAMRRVVLV